MEITGKVVQILQKQSGKSTRGDWSKHEFILETKDEFPKKVCISSWNDKVNVASLKPGTEMKVFINIESREYNGKWFTEVRAWKYELIDSNTAPAGNEAFNTLTTDHIPPEEEGDDLPF
ncbi:MAG: hypothetical protein A2W91_20515 [Bacteroidetes bacterium GWF2_38_335]|nr:MAG: hypothetical protein A2W91_20515 [Bacteroidetes bacterium GWF2_38_335]OFY79460.1 MAG: hypothetical protein A2281_13570 [Bacteroidetes bacterium RIFOXYA12_FULL_38_20]HBS86604.1 hypothetical protein [Bacteroidales bacterium]